MTRLAHITSFLDSYLAVHEFSADGGRNGLNVEGKQNVRTIALGVSPTQSLFEKAIAKKADMIITHHSLLFKGNAQRGVKGILGTRINTLLSSRISLISYHLPLDFHEEVGNNVLLLKKLGASYVKRVGNMHGMKGAVFIGTYEKPVSQASFLSRIRAVSQHPRVIMRGSSRIQTIAVCTGGADGQEFLEGAHEAGAHAYVTGDISEHVPPLCEELKMNFVGAGHYATEVFGVQELGKVLRKQFSVRTLFIKENNPY